MRVRSFDWARFEHVKGLALRHTFQYVEEYNIG
jgi:hypothetical protein